MSLLDDIWSEPLAEEPVPIPEQRQNVPLFLPGDSDEEMSSFQDVPPNTESTEVETTLHLDKGKLDAIFADVDNEDIFADADKPIDLEGMQRRAKAKIAATQPPTTTASSVDGSQATSKKDGPGQRRPLPKLDEERLLGPDGFPRLLKEYKSFKVSGKGREAHDLEKLFRIYHSWTHRLFPKYRFQDTVERVEKLCRSRRMAVNLHVWRDEAHGLTRIQAEEDAESGSESDGNQLSAKEIRSPPSGAQSEVSSLPETPIDSTRSGSAAPSVPSSATDMDDIDAMIREEEELMRELNGGDSIASKQYQVTAPAMNDEEALWAAAEGAPTVPQTELQAYLSKPLEEDGDLWDVIDDIQKSATDDNEVEMHSKSPAGSALTSQDNNELPTLGGEWDDMYE